MSKLSLISRGKEEYPLKNKKILLMGHSDGHGGAQTAFRKLYDFAISEGYIVKVVCITDNKKNSYFDPETVLGRITLQGTPIGFLLKKSIQLLNTAIKVSKFRPDLFVGVGLNNSTNLTARFAGSKCFKIGHDYIAERPCDDPIWFKSKAVMNAMALQAPSMLYHWQQVDPALNAINWLPCFPELPISGIQQKNNDVIQTEIRIAYFGRLASNKGLPLLLKSLSTVNTIGNLKLDIWGNGSEEKVLKKLINEYNLQDKVHLLGNYPEAEAGAKLMVSYDALVLCSTGAEGLPLILLEAMAYGVPFLVTNVGAIRDCCEKNPDAILVEPKEDEITNGLNLLIKRIETKDFDSERLRLYYEKNFSYNIMANRWRTCFHDPKRFFSDRL